MTILRTITNYRVNNKIEHHGFKIVYVAPMKALAAEIVRKFSKRLNFLNIQVRELTGDMQLTKAEINSTVLHINLASHCHNSRKMGCCHEEKCWRYRTSSKSQAIDTR